MLPLLKVDFQNMSLKHVIYTFFFQFRRSFKFFNEILFKLLGCLLYNCC